MCAQMYGRGIFASLKVIYYLNVDINVLVRETIHRNVNPYLLHVAVGQTRAIDSVRCW